MKHLNKYFLSLFILSVALLTSCSDDEAKLAKEIIFDDENVDLGNGYIGRLGYDFDDNGEAISVYEVILTESGITLDECGYPLGTGSAVILTLYSPSTFKLDNGSYEFIFDEDELKNTAEGFVFVNYDAEDDSADDRLNIISGKVSVSKSGQSFRIKLSKLVFLKDSDGSEVTGKGSWEGELEGIAVDCQEG